MLSPRGANLATKLLHSPPRPQPGVCGNGLGNRISQVSEELWIAEVVGAGPDCKIGVGDLVVFMNDGGLGNGSFYGQQIYFVHEKAILATLDNPSQGT